MRAFFEWQIINYFTNIIILYIKFAFLMIAVGMKLEMLHHITHYAYN